MALIGASGVLSSEYAFAEEGARSTVPTDDAASHTTGESAAEPVADAKDKDRQPLAETEHAAAEAYSRALARYATGDIQGALETMRESYRLSKRPELLYNLARLEAELRACPAALDDYRGYLQSVPRAHYREAALQAIEELERQCPVRPPAPAVAPEVQPTSDRIRTADQPKVPVREAVPTKYWTPTRWLGWSAIATGVLAGGGALYFTLAAVDARDNFQGTVDRYRYVPGGPLLDTTYRERQHRDQSAAQALAVTAGALVTGGALLLIFGPQGQPSTGSASISAQPGLVQAGYFRRF